MEKMKVFKDSIYGYIEIEQDIVKEIMNSKYFQRLRRIEQTSMRCLYPSAHHDRFIHSIGTYYLGTLAIKVLKKNTIDDSDEIKKECYFPQEEEQQRIEFSFQMACLLHDIGHSPFSHTLEGYYEKVYNTHNKDNPKHIKDILLERIFNDIIDDDDEYKSLKKDKKNVHLSPYEFVSNIIAVECFKDSLKTLADHRNTKMLYCFLVRCTLGCLYTNESLSTIGNFSNKSMQENLTKLDNEDVKEKFNEYLNEFKINEKDKPYDFKWTITKIKLSKIKSNDIIIFMNNKICEFNQLLNNNVEDKDEIEIFFYVYCSEENRKRLKDNNEEDLTKLIQHIKDFPYFKNVP